MCSDDFGITVVAGILLYVVCSTVVSGRHPAVMDWLPDLTGFLPDSVDSSNRTSLRNVLAAHQLAHDVSI